MAKISRKIKINENEINLDSGEVQKIAKEAWPITLQNKFVKCNSLVSQIVERKLNIVDETNIKSIAYSLTAFDDKGKNLLQQVCLFQNEYDSQLYLQFSLSTNPPYAQQPIVRLAFVAGA